MDIRFKKTYLNRVRSRYWNSTKTEKSEILDEFCCVCAYERKHAIRLLRSLTEPASGRKRGAKPKYSNEVRQHLVVLWANMNMCSKKMHAALPVWLEFYKASDAAKKELLQMSPATIDRILKPFRETALKKGLTATQKSFFKTKIPIKVLDEIVQVPGFIEADTVAHCGSSLMGEYINSITMTDLCSGWTINRAAWTKSAEVICRQIAIAEELSPFPWIGFASDNGSEFINATVLDYLTLREAPLKFVRRRAYKKNDNAHVEQKNWTHVRELFGYERFDDPDLTNLINQIYTAYWNPLWNYFTPVMKLKEKVRIGGRIKKKYDEPQTPYQRLMASPYLSEEQKQKLYDDFKCKNPFYLKEELEKRLKEFMNLVDAGKRNKKVS
jgi:hypothetical protein